MLKRFLLILILLTGCATTANTPPAPPTEFETACTQAENLGYSCADIAEPIIVVSDIVLDHYFNMYGHLRGVYYSGEHYVFIRPGQSPDKQWTTTVHEVAHYILHQNDPDLDRCKQEELARFIAGQEPDKWRELYNCPKEDDDAPTDTT